MDDELAAQLEELHRHGVEHDLTKPDRLDRLRNLEPETAQLLALLVRALDAKTLLELGTSNGYSTLWLADAMRATGGRLVSVELDRERSRAAGNNLERAGLEAVVELRVEDAAQALARSSDGQWDLIFLDAERPHYVSYWPDLIRSLRPGGLLAVDNVISHEHELTEFRDLVARSDGFAEALVPTGAGLLLILRER
jgi:predicted O-methyltransferase YrrM